MLTSINIEKASACDIDGLYVQDINSGFPS